MYLIVDRSAIVKKKKKSVASFCLNTSIRTVCGRVTHSSHPTSLYYYLSPCFRFLVNPVVINTCV